eukprot:UN01023
MGGWFSSILGYFYAKQLDIVMVGLSGAGKTRFSQILALDQSATNNNNQNNLPDTVPTIGLEIQIFQRDGVQCKVFDLGGQSAYRSEWPRYVAGSDIIVLVIDTQHPFDLLIVKKELHQLLDNPLLKNIPILILANKIDLGAKIETDQEIIESLNLDYLTENPWTIVRCSAKTGENVDKAIEFLLQHAH